MSVREYLKQLQLLDLVIDQYIMEQDDLDDIASRHPNNRKHCEEVKAHINNVITDLVNQKDQIIGQILQIKDYKYSEVLYLHYVRGMPLEDIADLLMKKNGKVYSLGYTIRIHGEALKEFRKQM